ncbi:MAG TPA: PQQ-dependent sugar dehydrogenase [Solirubrobacterales bacterium]
MRWTSRLAMLAVLLSFSSARAAAATLEPIGDFSQPIYATSDPADPNRLFVVEREGRVIEDATGAPTVLADISSLVQCCESERGLLSIAPAPDFHSSGRFYAAYTGNVSAGSAKGDIHVDAFHRESGSLIREPILTVGHDVNANHNGGQLQFGPDGNLYISTGDGGGGGDPFESGQSLSTLLGKILRFDPGSGAGAKIWSYGLRNPWRFSFDRSSGDMAIADVGQGSREEVDYVPSPAPGVVGGSGDNYGWNCREGFQPYSAPGASCTGVTGFTEPAFDYPHTDPGDGTAHGCSITGGYVVRDPSLGDLYGRYLYADYCVGEIRSLALPSTAGGIASGDRSEGLSVSHPVSFGEDSCGRLYVVSQAGTVYRFVGAMPASCSEPVAAPPGSPGPSEGGKGPLQGTKGPIERVEQGTKGSIEAANAQPVRLRLSARAHRVGDGKRMTVSVLATPCGDLSGTTVQLNQGGHRVDEKRLDRNCSARFRRPFDRRSTFRALLPDSGYRSQVLTIALAKPRP